MAQSKAKQLWDLFIEGECGSYEKSAWCNLFLAQVLSELKSGKSIQDILNFGNVSGIGNLIGFEILSAVHQVVSVPGDAEELEPLRTYLLHRGWRGVAVLSAMGNLNLSCSSELAQLLLFLYPLVLKNSEESERGEANPYLKLNPTVIDDFNFTKSPTKSKLGGSNVGLSLGADLHKALSHSSSRSRRLWRSMDASFEIDSNQSSDEPVAALQTSGGLFKLDPMDFDYFTSVVRSEDESRLVPLPCPDHSKTPRSITNININTNTVVCDCFSSFNSSETGLRLDSILYEPARRISRVTRPHRKDFLNDAINAVLDSSVSPYEFSLLSVQLLTSLAKAEHTFPVCPDNSYPTCTQCIKFSLENLCNLQFNSSTTKLNAEEVAELKVGWTQLLVLCLEKVMGSPDVTSTVILAGILPMMLRVLEDVVSKMDLDNKTERQEEVAYGLVCGSLGFLHSLMLQGSDPDSLRTFLEMVNQMIESGGGRLLDRTVLALGSRSRKALEILAHLVSAVKKLRWRLHCPNTRKSRPRKQKYMNDAYHHFDLFGSVASSPLLTTQQTCCIYNLTMVFVRLLQNTDKLPSDILNLSLRLLTSCGICCCTPVKAPLKALIRIVREGPSKSRGLAFTLFEKTIYPQLGAYARSTTPSGCIVCCQAKHSDSTWEKLELFLDLITKEETRQSHSVMCHLVRIAPRLRDDIKEIILYRVFFPAFLRCKVEYLKEKSEAMEFVILSVLSVLCSLLDDSNIQHFLTQRGVSHVLDLIHLPAFSKHCCCVLEKTIACEWNLSADVSAVMSLGMLQTAQETAATAFLSAAGAECGRKRAMGVKRGRNRKSESSVPTDPTGVADLVQSVSVFWRSYACLALSNPALRNHFAQTAIAEDSKSLFDIALACLTKTTPGIGVDCSDESVVHNLSKLVESLLTFILIVAPPESGVEETTITKLEKVLKDCDVTKVDIKRICEVVIKCSLAKPSSSLVLDAPKIPTMPIWSNWVDEPLEVESKSETDCSGDEMYVTADEGYEADVELRTNFYFGTDSYSIESESSSQFDVPGEKFSPTIIYPKLCKLAVDLILKTFNEKADRVGFDLEETLVAVLLRLGALCHESSSNCFALCRQSIVLSLLKGFAPCLTSYDSKYPNLRTVLLELITELGKVSFLPEELSTYLEFFKGEHPPLGELLKPLVGLASEPAPRPFFAMTFPVMSPPDIDQVNDRSLNRSHRSRGIHSGWGSAALSLQIPGNLGWSPWSTGCSISTWLRLDRISCTIRSVPSRKVSLAPMSLAPSRRVSHAPSMPRKISAAESHLSIGSTGISDWGYSIEEDTDFNPLPAKQVPVKKQLHLLSIGSENLMVECWLDLTSNLGVARLSRLDNTKGYEVVSEETFDSGLSSSAWHNLSLNIRDYVQQKKTVIEVTWIVDGFKDKKIQLPFTGLVIRKARDMSLLVGHQAPDFDGRSSLAISSVMLFRSSIFTRTRALTLAALGPNVIGLTEGRVGRPVPNVSPFITPESVASGLDWNTLLEEDSGSLRELMETLILVHSASDPTILCYYQGGANSGASSLIFRPLPNEPSSAQLPPTTFLSTILAPLHCKKNESILIAANLTGGSSIFLYLFARVVELNGSGAEQGDALCLLLRLVQSDTSLYSEFVKSEYHKLLRKVFLSSRCIKDLHLLKAILDACCDKPVLVDTISGLIVNPHSDAIVKNSLLLSTLAAIWMDAVSDNNSLLALFSALLTLLRDEHPYRDFNVVQLNRVRIMTTLLTFCKERLVSDDKVAIGHEVWLAIVELVRCLMGAPPEFSHVVEVMDTLLLLHPANTTYITHLKNSCYQLISAGQNYATQSIPPQSRSMRVLRQVTSMSLEKWVQVMKTQADTHDYTNPVDAKKLNKALANLQLQQQASTSGDQSRSSPVEDSDRRFSDEVTMDSGISDTCQENAAKPTEGSNSNLGFPNIIVTSDDNTEGSEKHIEDELEREDDCIVSEGLLLLLADVLLVLPDNMSNQVLTYVTKFEILLVMANHRNHTVRAAVVQLLSSYLKRASSEERSRFLKARGFHQLANQISLYPASLPLVEAALNLFTPCLVSLDEPTFILQMPFTANELMYMPPLLALLPRCVHDPLLTHHLINILRSVFCKGPVCARSLLDHGLTEVLVKALIASAHIGVSSDQITSQDIMIADLQSFFGLIVSHFLNSPGVPNMQVICDMKLVLQYVSRVEQESCGATSRCVRIIRETQCRLWDRCLEISLEKILALQSDPRSVASFLALGISSSDDTGSRSMTSSLSSASMSYAVSQSSSKELTKRELKERLNSILPFCTQFLVQEGVADGDQTLLTQVEQDFLRHLFQVILQMMSTILEKKTYSRRTGACAVFWAIRETLKTEAAELLVWLLSPRHTLTMRMFAVQTLLNGVRTKEIVSSLLQTHPQIEQKFTVFLWDLMYNNSSLSNAELRTCMEFKECLQQWSVLSPHAVGSSHDCWGLERDMLLNDMDRQRSVWEKQLEAAIIRCVTKYDALVKSVGEDAMCMTRVAVDAQNVERKALMAGIRQAVSAEVAASAKWRALVANLTNERSVWCDQHLLPRFWQLDPTEGPQRIRNRLMPTYLSIDARYLKPDHRSKVDVSEQQQPLLYLFERHSETCPSAVVIERLHCNEKIRMMSTACVITPAHEVPGELLLGEFSLYFVADDKHLCSTLDTGSTAWPFEDVREIHHRRFQLQERAIELFLRTGRTYLIAFETCKEKDDFYAALSECDLPNLVNLETLVYYTNMWRERQITNWEYLTLLNKIAGRSFNDLMQYPVFPFVLADYVSPTLDLANRTSFRNLMRPMAVQDKQNEQHYINNYNELLSGLKQVSLNRDPYHYGSHYSNSGTVLHFLVRLPPFTTMLLQYQDRNFDLPDRTFHSMKTTWRLTSCDSTTDVKELLPEFFYLPEFLTNFQGFDFGVRQNGCRVEDVELPPWSGQDPRKFILIHRQALESDAVTENLPHWIDLVFGYKQTGKAAVEAINVFHPATYCGFDVESIPDPLERDAWETMVKTYGQTPRQLFRLPHPLVIQSLVTTPTTQRPVLSHVSGLKWGNYVGSPQEPEPKVVWKQTSKDHSAAATLLPLKTNDVYALPPATTCLVRYTKEKGLSLVNSTSIRAALVSWGHPDGFLRLKVKKEQAAEPLIYISPINPVTTCCSVPESGQLWLGHRSGSLTVIKFSFRSDGYYVNFGSLPQKLQAHKAAVSVITMSRAFSIVVSAGRDGSLIIWDLNSVTYVRTIELGEPVVLTSISCTSGDIAAVVQSYEPLVSKMSVHTINGSFIGQVTVRDGPITSLCFSSAMEGVSVNAIAAGLANGGIRLWSTWDLSHIRDIKSPLFQLPIISLAYSQDAQHLYAGCADGTVIVWEGSGMKYDNNPPKFLNLKTLL